MTQNMKQGDNFKTPYVLALDIGTSSTRALLFDATGAAIPGMVSQHTYQLTVTGEGEVSVDADTLLKLVEQTIDEVLKSAGAQVDKIGAVAIDTFWHGLLGIDASGKPITPLITWEDTRAFGAAAQLRAQLDEAETHRRTGARFHASYWPAKLRWLATEQHDLFAQAAQWISIGEYLHRRLLGRSVCSLSMASGTGLLNTRARAWDIELMKVLDIRPEQLPELGDVQDGLKGLVPAYAERWPALRDVPWYPAIGDGAAACVGTICTDNKNWSLTIGTSSAMRVVVTPEQVAPPLGLWLYLIDGKRAVIGGALSEGGNMLAWIDTICKLPELKEAEPLIANFKPDEHGLTILPFISGERSLGWHAEARMTISGIHSHITPAHLLRAGMEALAYQLGAVYEELCQALQVGDKMPVPRLMCSGGALLSSPTLQRIIADTLGLPLYPSLTHEASACGVALLALEALGVIKDIASIEPNLGKPVQPDSERGEVYKKAKDRQGDLYKRMLA